MTALVVPLGAQPTTVGSSKRSRLYTVRPLVERFWAMVDKNGPVPPHRPDLGPCWPWLGSCDDRGYGQIREGRRGTPLLKAHRVAWAIENGPLPDDRLILHACDFPPCVRAAHLFAGSAGDNARDMVSKGRGFYQVHPERCPRGENAPGAKLTAAEVAQIRRLCALGWGQSKLAAEFGVSQAAIWMILAGRTWKPME